jgi:hypothetical protein
MPLASREPTRIALVSRQGFDVELAARSAFAGPSSCTWTVSGGQLMSQTGSRIRWRLPERPGLYQAQVVVDYGPQGLAFDALTLEVA